VIKSELSEEWTHNWIM